MFDENNAHCILLKAHLTKYRVKGTAEFGQACLEKSGGLGFF